MCSDKGIRPHNHCLSQDPEQCHHPETVPYALCNRSHRGPSLPVSIDKCCPPPPFILRSMHVLGISRLFLLVVDQYIPCVVALRHHLT